MMFPRLVRWLVLWLALAAPLYAQRPRTAAAALANFAKVEAQPESERRRAARDLGPFADEAVTQLLLRELAAAQDGAYRQDVVRALGGAERPGSVPVLAPLLGSETNPRMLDAVAGALAKQGDAGVQALGAQLAAQRNQRARRSAILEALGGSAAPAARALLLQDLKSVGGRDRLPALRALDDVVGDAAVDAVREALARDADPVVASAAIVQLARHGNPIAAPCAFELHQRGKPLDAQAHAAVLHGLLVALVPERLAAVLPHGALAEDPFGKPWLERWRAALADPGVARWLTTDALAAREPGERAFLAQCLGRLGGPAARTALATLLRDPPPVQSVAATALARLGDAEAQELLTAAAGSGSEDARATALAALHEVRARDPKWPEELLAAAASGAPAVQATALRLLCELAPPPPGLAPRALGLLDHKQASVRSAAIDALAHARSKDAIAPLIARLDKEQGRTRADVQDALAAITLQNFVESRLWQQWWQQAAATFEVPAPRAAEPKRRAADKAATVATYWDLPVTSERVVFVVDVSGSMLEPVGTGGRTRLDQAKQQLERVLPQLPAKARCNLIAFSTEAHAVAERLVDPKRRPALVAAARELQAHGATNVHAALQLAFADPDVDTVYLLSDGHPSAGAIVDGTALADEVQRWNRRRGIRIHTIALGGKSDFLDRLARDAGGESTVAR